jgi:hypothetical protein
MIGKAGNKDTCRTNGVWDRNAPIFAGNQVFFVEPGIETTDLQVSIKLAYSRLVFPSMGKKNSPSIQPRIHRSSRQSEFAARKAKRLPLKT